MGIIQRAWPAALLTGASILLASCNDMSVTPGSTVRSTRSVQGFTRLDVANGFEVTIVKGTSQELVIEAPEGFQPHIITQVTGGTLQIKLADRIDDRGLTPRRAFLTVTSLSGIEASGGSRVTCADTLTADRFTIDLSGGSALDLRLATGRTDVSTSGGAECRLGLTTSFVDLDASGGSKIMLNGRGTGSMSADFSGAAELRAFDFPIPAASVNASGGSELEVRAESRLDGDGSGGSRIYYKGHPAVDVELSGGARLIDAN